MLMCSKCKVVKPTNRFGPRNDRAPNGRRLGRRSRCLDCEQAYRLSPEGKQRAAARSRAFIDRLRANDIDRLRRKEKNDNLQSRFGIGVDEFEAMEAVQGGLCAICGQPPTKGRGPTLHVDHDHATGRIRGLLCHECNVGIGHFREDEARLLAAAEYLKNTVPIS